MAIIAIMFTVGMGIAMAQSGTDTSTANSIAVESPISISIANDGVQAPAYLSVIMSFIQGLPTVGPILNKALSFLGILSAILTFFASIILCLQKIFAQLGKSFEFADKANKILLIAFRWVGYLSVFNIQKAPDSQKKA